MRAIGRRRLLALQLLFMQVPLAVLVEVPDDLGVCQLAQDFFARLGAVHKLLILGHHLLGLREVGHIRCPVLLEQTLLRHLLLDIGELTAATIHVSAGAAARQVCPAIAQLALIRHPVSDNVILLFFNDQELIFSEVPSAQMLQHSGLVLHIAIDVLRQHHLVVVAPLNRLASNGRVLTIIRLISMRRALDLLSDALEPFISPPCGIRLLLRPANFLLNR